MSLRSWRWRPNPLSAVSLLPATPQLLRRMQIGRRFCATFSALGHQNIIQESDSAGDVAALQAGRQAGSRRRRQQQSGERREPLPLSNQKWKEAKNKAAPAKLSLGPYSCNPLLLRYIVHCPLHCATLTAFSFFLA